MKRKNNPMPKIMFSVSLEIGYRLIEGSVNVLFYKRLAKKLNTPVRCCVCIPRHKYLNTRDIMIGEFICDGIETIRWTDITDKESSVEGYLMPADLESGLDAVKLERYGKQNDLYGYRVKDFKIYRTPKTIYDFYKPCICPEMPYCPYCELGGECMSESEEEYYRETGGCANGGYTTEWYCNNRVKKAPRDWCYLGEGV